MIELLKEIKRKVITNSFSDYQSSLRRTVKLLPNRRKTRSARDFQQKVISDYRNLLRNQQRNNLENFKYKLFENLQTITQDKQLSLSVINTKDRFGYSFNFAIQRANTRLIRRIQRIYSDNYKGKQLDKVNFYQQANETVVEFKFIQQLIDYTVSRAINELLFQQVKLFKVSKVEVKLSKIHKIACVCDNYAKIYDIDKVVLPPFHLHCNCYVFPYGSNGLEYHTETFNKLLSQINKDL